MPTYFSEGYGEVYSHTQREGEGRQREKEREGGGREGERVEEGKRGREGERTYIDL